MVTLPTVTMKPALAESALRTAPNANRDTSAGPIDLDREYMERPSLVFCMPLPKVFRIGVATVHRWAALHRLLPTPSPKLYVIGGARVLRGAPFPPLLPTPPAVAEQRGDAIAAYVTVIPD